MSPGTIIICVIFWYYFNPAEFNNIFCHCRQLLGPHFLLALWSFMFSLLALPQVQAKIGLSRLDGISAWEWPVVQPNALIAVFSWACTVPKHIFPTDLSKWVEMFSQGTMEAVEWKAKAHISLQHRCRICVFVHSVQAREPLNRAVQHTNCECDLEGHFPLQAGYSSASLSSPEICTAAAAVLSSPAQLPSLPIQTRHPDDTIKLHLI